jgi:hypothetical protein
LDWLEAIGCVIKELMSVTVNGGTCGGSLKSVLLGIVTGQLEVVDVLSELLHCGDDLENIET